MPVVNQTFVIVEKSGSLKEVSVKNINKDEIYKKCGFRKPDGFECRTTWNDVKIGNQTHSIQLWARDDGKADTENKYDFPPPVDKVLYFGNCALVQVFNKDHDSFTNLSKDLWLKIYEKLFGGFEDIGDENDDDDEPDELATIKKEMKTKKTGYLKDGFVVDSEEEVVASDIEVDEESDDTDDSNESDNAEENECEYTDTKSDLLDNESEDISIGSELEEESYDYSDEEK